MATRVQFRTHVKGVLPVLKHLILSSALLTVLDPAALAQEDEDEPGRGVARISLLYGDVSVRRGDSGDIIAAAVNSPLMVQDRLLTGRDSRAEVQFDWANMMRLSQDAEARFAELESKRYMVQIARGTVTFRVLRDYDADVELSTPNVSVRPVKQGLYRISVLDDGSTEVTVRSGEAEIYTPRGSERLRPGRTMLARGNTGDPEFRYGTEIALDEWDRWNEQRDKDLMRSRSYDYVSQDIYGADDLDDHGQWTNVAQYGWVWAPRVANNWAPYRNGRWSWIDYYGWSWISHDPWGWAPYHYGRWFYQAPIGWCWWPGNRYGRHAWSPALVGFFGLGSTRPGLGFGNIGWVPLAPHERYYRWYGRGYYNGLRGGAFYDNGFRIANNVNITNFYRNSRIDHAITVVDHDGFGRGRPGSGMRFRDIDSSGISAFQGRLPLTPGRDSLRWGDHDPRVRGWSSRDNTRFFSRRAPAAVDKITFEDQRRGIEQVAQRAFGNAGGQSDRFGWREVGRGSDDGWRRFGSPRVDSPTAGFDSNRSERNAGRFGQPAEGSDRGWRRVGERSQNGSRTESPATDRPANESRFGWRNDNSWQRNAAPPRVEQPRTERQASPRFDGRGDGMRRGGGDSVRISPPIVRERSGGVGGSGGGRFSGGGGAGGAAGGGGRSGGGGGGSRGGGGRGR